MLCNEMLMLTKFEFYFEAVWIYFKSKWPFKCCFGHCFIVQGYLGIFINVGFFTNNHCGLFPKL